MTDLLVFLLTLASMLCVGLADIVKIRLAWGVTALNFIKAAAVMRLPDGRQLDEVAIIGPRSEGKSWASLGAVLAHAQAHEAAGHSFPIPWLWFRDTFPNHEANLVKDVQRLEWQGIWRVSDGGRIIAAEMNGARQIEARLFGLEDIGAVERMRGQAVGVYGEEPGPVIGATVSTGWTEAAWETALSSIGDKIKSHAYPGIIASNPSQRSHWFWKRFVLKPSPTTGTFRIPKGERTTEEYRDRNARIFRSNPNLFTRLVEGEASVASMGDPVITGYHSSRHYSTRPLPVAFGPLYFGWDAYHHPACVIGSLSDMGQLRIHYARRMDQADIGLLVDEGVKPWLSAHNLAQRERIHVGDPTMETGDQSDRDMNAKKLLLQKLPGRWAKSTNKLFSLQAAVNGGLRSTLSTGEPRILLGPDAGELDESWSGGWYVDELGKGVQQGERGQHSHVGMAGSYLVHAVFAMADRGAHLERYVQQSAYVGPWAGQEHSVSPAIGVLRDHQETHEEWRAKWKRQYDR